MKKLINAKNTKNIGKVNEKIHDGAMVLVLATLMTKVILYFFGTKE
jgi:hypothetical protein